METDIVVLCVASCQASMLADIEGRLREKETPRDVATAEELLKKHGDLLDDINATDDK